MFLQSPENGKRFTINSAINLSVDKPFLLHFFSATWHFSFFLSHPLFTNPTADYKYFCRVMHT
jgi:hypothetical protein